MEMHHIEPLTTDFITVKHLLSEAEMLQQQQQLNLATHESALLAAQAQHTIAKAAYDESTKKVESLKSQFRDQIMEEGLRQTSRWNDMYYKLVEWKERHDGDTTVPCDPKSSDEVAKLNRWVINQRTAYKYFMNGDKKHIKDHRINALNKIGFVWSVTDQIWDNNFEELKKHHAEHGTFNITHKQNRKLATFISRLRTAMSHRNEGLVQQELTQDRIDKLDSIGFTWKLRRKARKSSKRDTVKFDFMYNHLVSFKEIYGHLKVNKLEKEWKKGVGKPEKKVFRRLPLFMAFVRKEQLLYVAGQPCALDEEKVGMLTNLGVEWKKPMSEPRKSTGGEASRKKRKKTNDGSDGGGAMYQYQDGGHLTEMEHHLEAAHIPGMEHHSEAEHLYKHAAMMGNDDEDAAAAVADIAAAAVAALGNSEMPTIPPPSLPKPEQGMLL